MPDGFNAKQHSIGKCYVYRLYRGDVVSPFQLPYVWQIKSRLDLDAMRRAAAVLVGEHDFESFRSVQCDAAHARRYLWQINIEEHDAEVHIIVRGNAFCRNMVRIIAGTLVEIGRGKINAEQMPEILAAKNRSAAGVTAPGHALLLSRVYYPDNLADAQIPREAVFPNHPWDRQFWPPNLLLKSQNNLGTLF